MNSGAKVTILLPVYNCGKCLLNAVKSVVDQSFNGWKLLIVDDGSTKIETAEILKSIIQGTNKVEVIRLPENKGIINALNTGLEHVNTQYVARIDCDDWWKPGKLEKQIAFLENHPEYVMVATWADVRTFGQPTKKSRQSQYAGYKNIKSNIFKYNFIVHSSVVMRTEIIRKEKYAAKFKHVEDYELWLRMACKYPIEILPEPLTVYNFGKGSVSYRYAIRQKANEILLKLSYISQYPKKYYLLYNFYELLKLIFAKAVNATRAFLSGTKSNR